MKRGGLWAGNGDLGVRLGAGCRPLKEKFPTPSYRLMPGLYPGTQGWGNGVGSRGLQEGGPWGAPGPAPALSWSTELRPSCVDVLRAAICASLCRYEVKVKSLLPAEEEAAKAAKGSGAQPKELSRAACWLEARAQGLPAQESHPVATRPCAASVTPGPWPPGLWDETGHGDLPGVHIGPPSGASHC